MQVPSAVKAVAPGVPETQQHSLRVWGFSDGGDNFDKLDEEMHTVAKEMALKREKQIVKCVSCYVFGS